MEYRQCKKWWIILYALSVINILLGGGFDVFQIVIGRIICEVVSSLCVIGLTIISCIIIYKLKQLERNENKNRKEIEEVSQTT